VDAIYKLVDNTTTGFVAGAMFRADGSSTGGPALVLFDVDGVDVDIQLIIACRRHGMVEVCRGDYTVLGASDLGVFYYDTWFNLEVKYHINNTSGYVEVRVDGKTVLSLVDVDTQNTANAYANAIGCGKRGSSSNMSAYVDDFAAWDTTGGVNDDWLGTNRVKTQFVIANGDNIDSTIGGTSPAATNWQSVLNYDLDDTKYVYIPYTAVGDYDLYDVDPNISAPIVHAVQIRVGARQDDATQLIMRTLLKSGSTTTEGPDEHLSQTYNHYFDMFDLNPDTGFGWTQSEANAIQVGYKLQDVE
jgi:hypothetical protein